MWHKPQGFSPLTASPDTLGSRFSSGTSTSSMRIIPVDEALRENFPSIFGVERPFMPRSRMKPRTFPSSHLAQTTATSATGELVILRVGVQKTAGRSRHSLLLCTYIMNKYKKRMSPSSSSAGILLCSATMWTTNDMTRDTFPFCL